MRLLHYTSGGELSLTDDLREEDVPPYAILSHTWNESQEVTFDHLKRNEEKDKTGYNKIRFCAQQAKRDGLHYVWVDTCCIDKSSSSELQEAINSMFRWYQRAVKCYVYLSDVSNKNGPYSSDLSWELAFKRSRWFTRGWTLQELLAPSHVEFFSVEEILLGDKSSLETQIHETTSIPIDALQGRSPLSYSIIERFNWAEGRGTKREEDMAYALLGLFDVHIPLIYGEGYRNAFRRLCKEVQDSSNSSIGKFSTGFLEYLKLIVQARI
jgi:hypothetical protein